MYRKSFVRATISSLEPKRFSRLVDILNNEKYIPFEYVGQDKINYHVLEEKVSDYFEKVELVAGGKSFNSLIEQYAYDLDSVVRDHIDGAVHSIMGGPQNDSRAKKYYDRAMALKKAGLKSFDDLLDYSRIMLCLYMAIIKKNHKTISNFDFSSKCLVGKDIIKSLRSEKTSNLLGEKRRFDTKGAYSLDRCTFVLVILMYQYIKNKEAEA